MRTKHVAFLALILLLPWVSACTESEAMNTCFIGGGVPTGVGACAEEESFEQAATSDLGFGGAVTTNYYWEIIPGKSYTMSMVTFTMKRSDTGGATWTVSLYAYDDADDEPTGSVLASTTQAHNDLPADYTDHNIVWDTPVAVTASTQYCVTWVASNNSSEGRFYLNNSGSDDNGYCTFGGACGADGAGWVKANLSDATRWAGHSGSCP